jgi:hypothetical protein
MVAMAEAVGADPSLHQKAVDVDLQTERERLPMTERSTTTTDLRLSGEI